MTPPLDAVMEAAALHEPPEAQLGPLPPLKYLPGGALEQKEDRAAVDKKEERARHIKEAAKQLGVNEAHLRHWIEGKDRLEMPKDQGAEEAVVGAVLDGGRPTLAKVKDLVKVEQLTHPALQAILQAALDLDAAGAPIHILSITQQMRASQTLAKLQPFQGEVYLAELANRAPPLLEAVEQQARVIVNKAVQREVLELAQEMRQQAQKIEGQPELEKLTERLRERLRGVEEQIPRRRIALFDKEHFLSDSLEGLGRPIPEKLPFGLPQLDKALAGGFPAGGVVALVAPPKYLKTALLIAMMIGWARRGQRSIYITGENTAQEIYARLSAHEQFGHTYKFHSTIKHEAHLATENRKWLEWMAGLIRVVSLPDEEIKDPPGLHWSEAIRLVEDQVEAENKVKLNPGEVRPAPPMLIIDYVEEFADRLPGRAALTEQQANKQVMRSLKNYACRRQGRVFAVCSVGRSNYSGQDNLFMNEKAKPADFAAAAKHSGYIDYAASAVLALQFVDKDRKEIDDPETGYPCTEMKLHLAFTREGSGPVTVPVLSFGGYCRFREDTEQTTKSEPEDELPGLEGAILKELARDENCEGLNIDQLSRALRKRVATLKPMLKKLAEDGYLRVYPGRRNSIIHQHKKFSPMGAEQMKLN